MGIKWIDIIEKIYREIDDIMINCPLCSSSSRCVEELTQSLPMGIRILGECCACVFETVLDSMPTIDRLYTHLDTGDSIAIYALDDIIIEVSQTSVMLVPITLLTSYLDLIDESGYRDTEIIKNWLKNRVER
ncbi:MAG: hypothetical protein QXY23_01195 [Ignisphaera sp.]